MYARGTESQQSPPGPVRHPGPARSRCRGWRSIQKPPPCPHQLHFETAGPGSLSVSPPLAEPSPAQESRSKVGIPAPSAGHEADPKPGTRGCSHPTDQPAPVTCRPEHGTPLRSPGHSLLWACPWQRSEAPASWPLTRRNPSPQGQTG